MEISNIAPGNRLKAIRFVFNEGKKFSAEQFAYILEESADKVRNYELGRASIPLRILDNLYHRGFNPNYIITGEGNVLLDNEAGKKLKNQMMKRNVFIENLVEKYYAQFQATSMKSLRKESRKIDSVAAGIIKNDND